LVSDKVYSIRAQFMSTGTWLTHQETIMNKDQVKGRVEEVKGKLKETAGEILDDDAMEAEGNIQKHVGRVQAGIGNIKEDVKDEIRKHS
jgi:uncharacterized protein YjbJ (UPF0337 family)